MKPILVLCSAVLTFALAPAAAAAPPANDDFDRATVISTLPFADVVDTTEATTAPDDPSPSNGCANGSAVATVWYSLTPARDMTIRVDTSGSDYFAVTAAYTGSRGALSEIRCGPPLSLDLTAGVKYSFMVFPLPGTAPGLLSFRVEEIPPVTVAVTINSTGFVNKKTGVATVSGTVTCSTGSFLSSAGGGSSLEQLFANRIIIRGFFDVPTETPCMGAPLAWSVPVTSSNGLFGTGSAQASVSIDACSTITFECKHATAAATIKLKAARG